VLLVIGGLLAYRFLPAPWWVVAVALLACVEIGEVAIWLHLRGRRPLIGREALVSSSGRLTSPDRVRIGGTSYRARVIEGQPGDDVVVVGVEGMTLVVRRRDA
jgi:membrane protein implicated in regulation of membrane protease activity